MADTPQRIPEHRIEQILTRAIELDELYRRQMSIAEIRSVAAEIGVSREAVDRAIEEAQNFASTHNDDQASPSWRLPVAATAYGLVLGSAASTLFASRFVGSSGDWLAAGAFAFLQISGVALAASMDPNHRHFQRCNFGLWFGAASGVAVGASVAHVSHAVPWDFTLNTLLGWVVRGWVLSAITGSAALLIRSTKNAHREDSDSHGPLSDGVIRLKEKVASALHRIADHLSGPKLIVAVLSRKKQPAA